MLTIEALRAFGADTEQGLSRCLNNETFYLRLVKIAAQDANFSLLFDAMEKGDKKAAFEAAHALKGMLGNLALTPLAAPIAEMTELLRHEAEADYAPYLTVISERVEQLRTLVDS